MENKGNTPLEIQEYLFGSFEMSTETQRTLDAIIEIYNNAGICFGILHEQMNQCDAICRLCGKKDRDMEYHIFWNFRRDCDEWDIYKCFNDKLVVSMKRYIIDNKKQKPISTLKPNAPEFIPNKI